jgi:dihydroneopterin aldolase
LYKIEIANLEFDTIIGILDYERTQRQKVVIDFECKYEIIDDYINYADIRDIIKDMMIKNSYFLIEDALNEILDFLVAKYPQMGSIKLKISKPDILQDCVVSVSKNIR